MCRNKDLATTRPDKESGVVYLNGTDCFSNAMSILDKFTPLDTNILDIYQKRENKLIIFLWDTLVKKASSLILFIMICFLQVVLLAFYMDCLRFIKLTFPLDLHLDSAIKFSLSKN